MTSQTDAVALPYPLDSHVDALRADAASMGSEGAHYALIADQIEALAAPLPAVGEAVAWRWQDTMPGRQGETVWRIVTHPDDVAHLRGVGIKLQALGVLADRLLPDGSTMGEWSETQLRLVHETGQMPTALLLDGPRS